jgi:cyclopropane fatty-acyl-phospholipid synthase-like methyltransferase
MNERSIEYAFVFKYITAVSPKSVLDIGTGLTALPAMISACDIRVQAIDNNQKQINQNKFCKAMIKKADILAPNINKVIKDRFDMITCVSVLEHIGNYQLAVKNMVRLLNHKGIILFTFPFNYKEYHKSAYKIPGAGYGTGSKTLCQIFNEDVLIELERCYKIEVVMMEYWKVFSGLYWTFGKRIPYPVKVRWDQKHQMACVALRKI